MADGWSCSGNRQKYHVFSIVRHHKPTHTKPFHCKADVSSEALMRGIREKFLRESHAFDAQDLAAMKQLQSTDTHRYQVPHELFL